MLERLFPLLHDTSSHNRAVTNMLLLRCLKNNPKTASRIVPAVFNCLHSAQPDVVQSVCDRMPEVTVCCQGKVLKMSYRKIEPIAIIPPCFQVISFKMNTLIKINNHILDYFISQKMHCQFYVSCLPWPFGTVSILVPSSVKR